METEERKQALGEKKDKPVIDKDELYLSFHESRVSATKMALYILLHTKTRLNSSTLWLISIASQCRIASYRLARISLIDWCFLR